MEKVKVEILAPAQQELEEIILVQKELTGVESAKKLADKIYKALGQLASYPNSGPEINNKELRIAGYRLLVVDQYLFIYRIIESTVYIYHIVHGATDYPALFKSVKKR